MLCEMAKVNVKISENLLTTLLREGEKEQKTNKKCKHYS